MELYYIDNKYLDYVYSNVDREVLYSHSLSNSKGRANVLVLRSIYKGYAQDFAVPFKGEIDARVDDNQVVYTNVTKSGRTQAGGFIVSKMMPIESVIINELSIYNNDFRQIATEITRKEPELIAKTQAHLKRLEMFAPSRFSTNVDKQLQFLRAYVKLRRVGVSEREIYSRSFNDNLNIARRL